MLTVHGKEALKPAYWRFLLTGIFLGSHWCDEEFQQIQSVFTEDFSYFHLFSPLFRVFLINSSAHAIISLLFRWTTVDRLYAILTNVIFTLILLVMVTKVWPPFCTLLITEYGRSPGVRFLEILRFLRTCFMVRGVFLDALSMVALMPRQGAPWYHLPL